MDGLPDLSESTLPRPGGRLLVVDDEHHITAAIRDYFTMLGDIVDVADSGSTALALLDQFAYAAVVTDLSMSNSLRMEGLDIIREVRARRPQAACIVLTAYGDPRYEAEAFRQGADAFLQKPTPLSTLAEHLAEILDGRSACEASPDGLP